MTQQLEQLLRVNTAALGLLAQVVNRIDALNKSLNKGGASSKNKAPTKSDPAAAGASKSLGMLAGAAGGVAAALAAIPAILAGIVFAALPFVKALSPAAVEFFNAALDDLNATIGSALLPIITEATAAFKVMSGAILPLMNQMRPIIAKLAAAVTSLVSGAFRYLVAIVSVLLTAAEPLIGMVAGLVEGMGQYFEVLAVVVQVLGQLQIVIDVLRAAMNPIGTLFEALTGQSVSLRTIFVQLAGAAAFAAAGLLKVLGATDTLAKFKDQLKKSIAERKNPSAGLKAAPGDSGTSGIEDIARKFSEAAFKATAGGTPARPEADIMEDILKAVELGESADWKAIIADGVREGMKSLPGAETARSAATVARSVFDASATGAERGAAAREAGGGFLGATAARGAGLAVDVADVLTFGMVF